MREEIKEYFQNCEYVTRAPGSFFLEGNKYTKKAKVVPVPLYAYAGIEKSSKGPLYEERDMTDFNKEIEKNIIKFSDKKDFSLFSIDRCNRLFYFNKYFSEDDKNDNAGEYYRLKVWSDITPNAGLNESSAIASAIALLVLAKEDMQDLIKFEALKKKKKEIATDYFFGEIFLEALGFDFFSNGAAILASLLGLSKERELIDYECLFYDYSYNKVKESPTLQALSRFRHNFPPGKECERDDFSEYEALCYCLSKSFEEGTPLYRWNYADLSSVLKQVDPIEISVIKKDSPLDSVLTNTELEDDNIKCFMIYPYSVAIFGSSKVVTFYEKNGNDLIFKRA